MLKGRKETPKNIPSGMDKFGFFKKSKNTTGRSGGIKTRGPVKGR